MSNKIFQKGFLVKIATLIFVPLTAFASAHFDEHAPASPADPLHATHSVDPVDHGWLPNLTGLPDKKELNLLKVRALDVIAKDEEQACRAININLKMLIFQHFLTYQHMLNKQNAYLDKKIARQWAHVLAMILQESSGDTTNITDFSGHSFTTSRPNTNLNRWNKILSLSKSSRVRLDYQTNFGLTQTSADRLIAAFHLAKAQIYNTDFLEGINGAQTPRKINLNTAIAIRRLIWFYQDFAQGRVSQLENRLPEEEIKKPEFSARYQFGLDMALLYCGSSYLFGEEYLHGEDQGSSNLRNALASISYCKLGNSHRGYGISELDEKCYAQWVTICPALNIDIAMLTPLSYFATRNAQPVCEESFKKLLNKKSDETDD